MARYNIIPFSDNLSQDLVSEACEISGDNGLSEMVPDEAVSSTQENLSDVEPPDKSARFSFPFFFCNHNLNCMSKFAFCFSKGPFNL